MTKNYKNLYFTTQKYIVKKVQKSRKLLDFTEKS